MKQQEDKKTALNNSSGKKINKPSSSSSSPNKSLRGNEVPNYVKIGGNMILKESNAKQHSVERNVNYSSHLN